MPRVTWVLLVLGACLAGLAGLMALGPAQDTPPQPAPPSQPAGPSTQPLASRRVAEPLDLVPAESLLCWYGRPFPDTTPPSDEPSMIRTLWQVMPRLVGLALDAQWQLWARVIEGFGLAIRYPHALVLIDAQAKPLDSDPDARRVDRLRLALIVHTGGQDEHFLRVIQAAVNEQTDNEQAALTREQAGPWEYQKLSDTQLPTWCQIAWGRIGEQFVLTLGPDVWPMIAAVATGQAPALSRDEWLVKVRGRRGRDALIEIIVAVNDIRQRLDPFVDGRATDFFRAWHAEGVEHMHWALGFEGPALYCVAHFLERGQTVERLYADPSIRDPHLLATIPDTARYAIYRVSPARVIRDLVAGFLATRDPDFRQAAEELWVQLQAEHGFDAQRDILAHLGEHVVMHNDPPHRLHIPLVMTTLTEIHREPDKVRQTIDTMCQAWRAAQLKRAAESDELIIWNVERDGPGIWYLQYGPVGGPALIAGPAWTVTDRFIITSWSPKALRSYLEKVGNRVGQRSD